MASSGSDDRSQELVPVESPEHCAEATSFGLSLQESLLVSSIPGMEQRLTQALTETASLQHSMILVRDGLEELQEEAVALRSDVRALRQRVQALEGRLDTVEDSNGKFSSCSKAKLTPWMSILHDCLLLVKLWRALQTDVWIRLLLRGSVVDRPFRALQNELSFFFGGCCAQVLDFVLHFEAGRP